LRSPGPNPQNPTKPFPQTARAGRLQKMKRLGAVPGSLFFIPLPVF
jgi:hypothetical protein